MRKQPCCLRNSRPRAGCCASAVETCTVTTSVVEPQAAGRRRLSCFAPGHEAAAELPPMSRSICSTRSLVPERRQPQAGSPGQAEPVRHVQPPTVHAVHDCSEIRGLASSDFRPDPSAGSVPGFLRTISIKHHGQCSPSLCVTRLHRLLSRRSIGDAGEVRHLHRGGREQEGTSATSGCAPGKTFRNTSPDSINEGDAAFLSSERVSHNETSFVHPLNYGKTWSSAIESRIHAPGRCRGLNFTGRRLYTYAVPTADDVAGLNFCYRLDSHRVLW